MSFTEVIIPLLWLDKANPSKADGSIQNMTRESLSSCIWNLISLIYQSYRKSRKNIGTHVFPCEMKQVYQRLYFIHKKAIDTVTNNADKDQAKSQYRLKHESCAQASKQLCHSQTLSEEGNVTKEFASRSSSGLNRGHDRLSDMSSYRKCVLFPFLNL